MLKKSILLFIVVFCYVEKNHGAAFSEEKLAAQEEATVQEAAVAKIPMPLRLPDLADVTKDNVCEKTYDYLQGILFSSNTSLNRSSTWSAGKHSPRHDIFCAGDNFKTHSPRNQEHFETLVQPSLQPIKDFIAKLRDKNKMESKLRKKLNKIPTSLQHPHHFSVWYFFAEFSQQDLKEVFRKIYHEKPIAAIDAIASKIFTDKTNLPIGDIFVWFLQRHINNATSCDGYFETLDTILENNQKLFDDCSMLFGFEKKKLRVKQLKRSTSATLLTPRKEAAKATANQPDITPADLLIAPNFKDKSSLDPNQEIPAFYRRRRPSVSTASRQNILPQGRNSDPANREFNRNFTDLSNLISKLHISNIPSASPEDSGTPKGPRSKLSSSSVIPFNNDKAIVNRLAAISDKVSMSDFVACFTQEIQALKTSQQVTTLKQAWNNFLAEFATQEELDAAIDRFGIADALLNGNKQAIEKFNDQFNRSLKALDYYNIYQFFKQLYDEKVATLNANDKGKEEAVE